MMDEHFLTETDKDGNPVNFKPVETTGGWVLVSCKTGKQYSAVSFLDDHGTDSIFQTYLDEYTTKVRENVSFFSPVFMIVWLKKYLMYRALEYRERGRIDYLAEFMKPDLSPKETLKVHKGSEKIYQDRYEEYFRRKFEGL